MDRGQYCFNRFIPTATAVRTTVVSLTDGETQYALLVVTGEEGSGLPGATVAHRSTGKGQHKLLE